MDCLSCCSVWAVIISYFFSQIWELSVPLIYAHSRTHHHKALVCVTDFTEWLEKKETVYVTDKQLRIK